MNDVRPEPTSRRKVRTFLALALLEAMRDNDFPSEVLEDEDMSVMLPRRLGLSGMVDGEIRRYRQSSGLRSRVPATEFAGLVRLVARRPDAKDVFCDVGRSLAPTRGRPLWSWMSADRRIAAVRGRVARRLHNVFGRKFISARRGSPVLQAVDGLLVEADPGGNACALVTGCIQGVIERVGLSARAIHAVCVVRGGEGCSWEIRSTEAAEISDGSGEEGEAGAHDSADREGGAAVDGLA